MAKSTPSFKFTGVVKANSETLFYEGGYNNVTFNQSGGHNIINGRLNIIDASVYNISDGFLNAGSIFIGTDYGGARFNQTGGSVITEEVEFGNSGVGGERYNLSGGKLSAKNISFFEDSIFNFSGG